MLRRINAFFYDHFMDDALLHARGMSPADPRRAFVDGYALRIPGIATLVPEADSKAFGMVYALTRAELTNLYAAQDHIAFRAVPVQARLVSGGSVPALCFSLPDPPDAEQFSHGYARRLAGVMIRLGLPTDGIRPHPQPQAA